MSSAKPTEVFRDVDQLEQLGPLQSGEGSFGADRTPYGIDASFGVVGVRTATGNQPVSSERAETVCREAEVLVGRGKVPAQLTIEKPADPSKIIDNRPVVVYGGYLGVEAAYADFRGTLASLGYIVATWEQLRKSGTLAYGHVAHPEKLHMMTGWAVTKRALEETDANQAHLAGNSMGGPNAAKGSLVHPKQTASVTVIATAGGNRQSLPGRLARLASTVPPEVIPHLPDLYRAGGIDTATTAMRYITDNIGRMILEGVACSLGDLAPVLRQVRQQEIPTAGIFYRNDRLFPLAKVLRRLEPELDLSSVFEDPTAGHAAMTTHPKTTAAHYAQTLDSLLQPYALTA